MDTAMRSDAPSGQEPPKSGGWLQLSGFGLTVLGQMGSLSWFVVGVVLGGAISGYAILNLKPLSFLIEAQVQDRLAALGYPNRPSIGLDVRDIRTGDAVPPSAPGYPARPGNVLVMTVKEPPASAGKWEKFDWEFLPGDVGAHAYLDSFGKGISYTSPSSVGDQLRQSVGVLITGITPGGVRELLGKTNIEIAR